MRRRRIREAVNRQREPSVSALSLLAVLLVPVALGVGVLVGRDTGGSDASLLAALRAAQASAATAGGGPTGGAVSTGGGAAASTVEPVSRWSAQSGYTVALSSLGSGTTPAAAARIERADRAKGATSLGILATAGYRITPAVGGAYVVYSGTYGSALAANRALRDLRARFPRARVIEVVLRRAADGGGAVVTRTAYGAAHQVSTSHPSTAALQRGAQVAAQDSHATGRDASGAGLPDVVAVP
jgi:hypothetical protein